MGRLPRFLLTYQVTVEPYLSWGVWGPARSMRCALSERIASATASAGVQQLQFVTVYADVREVCPPGSKVALADGRRGFAAAIVYHRGGYLPTPDHLEVNVELAVAYGPAFGETVVVLRRSAAGRDRYHNQRYSTVEVPVAGCSVRPLQSVEQMGSVDGRDQVSDDIEVIMPPDAVVSVLDRMRVRGLVFEVNGTPTLATDAMTAARPGLKVNGRRIAG